MSTQPPKYTTLLPSRWGWFLGMSKDSFQTGSVWCLGEWAPVESEILRLLAPEGGTVIDVGANVGGLTLALAAAVGESGRVLSFEPQRYCYMCLCGNLALNSLMHFCQAHQVAIGDTLGHIDVPILDVATVNNFGGASLLDEHHSPLEKVPLITIDSINLPACHLIKIDVEGMEPAVLRGAAATITKYRPIIWAECLEARDTAAELKAIFAQHNYRAWIMVTPLYIEGNTRCCRFNGFKNPQGETMGDRNVLAIPSEIEPPQWLAGVEVFA